MKPVKKNISVDEHEEGAIISALNDLRNKELSQGNSTDLMDELILKIIHAPQRQVKLRDEAR